MTKQKKTAVELNDQALETVNAAGSMDGIGYLVAVTQLKAQNSSSPALVGSNKAVIAINSR